jgi:DNA-binding PadR family transcriptional regulator
VTDAAPERGGTAALASPTSWLVLGLLVERPGYRYEVGKRATDRLGPAWKFNQRGIYIILDSLVRSGLAEAEMRQTPRRAKQSSTKWYFATPDGRAALEGWLLTPLSSIRPWRPEIVAKLAVARPEDMPDIMKALDEYERDCFALVSAVMTADTPAPLTSSGDAPGSLAPKLLNEHHEIHLEAELRWIAYARAVLSEFQDKRGAR